MKKLIVVGVMSWLCSVCVNAQTSNLDDLCAAIKDKVVVTQHPLEIFRQDVFKNDCVFRFSLAQSPSITIRVEKYESIAETTTELKSLEERFSGFEIVSSGKKKPPRNRFQNIDPDGFWDRAVAHKNDVSGDNYVLLRRDKYLIQIFGRNFSAMENTERLLRNIRFE